jgi:hypothetical protein
MRYLGQAPTINKLEQSEPKAIKSDIRAGLPELLIIGLLLLVYGRIRIPQIFPNGIDIYLGTPAIFSLVVIAQGLLGGMGLVQIPERLKNLQQNPIARFCFMSAIAYTATSDLELAVLSTATFALIMHILRTEEEKAKVPYLI